MVFQVLALGLSFLTGRCALRTSTGKLRGRRRRGCGMGSFTRFFRGIFPREGNFNGVTARLDELKDLGVNILWLMPIHPLGEKMRKGSAGRSPYAVRDYYAINPDYGTEADFKRLVSEAHSAA